MRFIQWFSLFVSLNSVLHSITIGSKKFPESILLAEIAAQLLETNGFTIHKKLGLQGTSIAYQALKNKDIDIYPEYTGTISYEILKRKRALTNLELKQALKKQGIELGIALGFNNSYGLAIAKELSDKLQIKTISDLKKHKKLKIGISYEFKARKDGWLNLKQLYDLQNESVILEHAITYKAIARNDIQGLDVYTTDGKIKSQNLVVLIDDQRFFPQYRAHFLYNNINKKARDILARLENKISDQVMQDLNYKIEVEKKPHEAVVNEFLRGLGLTRKEVVVKSQNQLILQQTWEHAQLSTISLVLGLFISLTLAFALYRHERLMNVFIYNAGLIQVIPSIALLGLLVIFMNIGQITAITALTLYTLLPLMRSTTTALRSIDSDLIIAAKSLGLEYRQILKMVLSPLAMPNIISGIRTAAVLNISFTTLASFVGAGGLGNSIFEGIHRLDNTLILKATLATAALAIFVELLFQYLEKKITPKNFRNF